MQDLTPVGLSQDGTRLLLVDAAGEEFSVPVDTRLRAALRGENARLGQLEMKMESALRPRDIQARIRAGETPEEVAAAAQTSVEAIMGFATPVLAERAHVASTAQRASVRRRSGESSSAGRTLGEAAELFFADHKLHDEDVEWDAWRRPDGRWALVASYAAGGRQRSAEFTHDLPGRYVIAENDEARILTGEISEPGSPVPSAAARADRARRLSSVPSQDELPLGDDAIELVRDREPAADEPTDLGELAEAQPTPEAPTEAPAEAPAPDRAQPVETIPLFEEPEQPARPQRAEQADSWSAATADTADADWIAGDVSSDEPATDPRSGDRLPADEPLDAEGQAQADDAPAPEKPAPSKKRSRSSVPSWDEIMFGGGKTD
jgi:hypothetical protein